MKVDIVVCYNNEKVLRKVFLRSRDLKDAKVFLIENGKKPVGLPELFNRHISTSTADWLIFCDQEFVVHEKGWIDRIRALEPTACYGPIGANLEGQLIGRIRQTDGTYTGHRDPLAEVSTVDDLCVIIPRRIYQELAFDPRFPFDLYVCDYCLEAKKLGYSTRIFQLNCQVKLRTLDRDIDSPRYTAAKQRFIEKHRDATPLATTTFRLSPKCWTVVEQNSELEAELELVGVNRNVLEIGPGSGHMTQALSKRGCNITSIEIDPILAERVKSFCDRLIVGDIEQLDLDCELRDERFDAILLGDVLEHLKDPARVIQKLKPLINPSGHLVVGLPNVAHASVRLALFKGDFDLTDTGILDRTHLRFFTLKTILGLFRENGFEIRNLHRSRLGFFNTETVLNPAKIPVSLLRRLARDPEASTFQFVFSAVTPNAAANLNAQLNDEGNYRDSAWSSQWERTKLARDLATVGTRKMHNNQMHEARLIFYRSLMVKPSGNVVFQLLRSYLHWGGPKQQRDTLALQD